MKVWVFGDTPDDGLVSLKTKVEAMGYEYQSLALAGTALEFTYQRFNIARKKIANNDTVIVVLTDFNRRWFFREYPQAAITDRSPTDNKKENKAIDLFREHLDHKEIHRVYLIDFLYNLYALTEERNLRTIVVPEFDDVRAFLQEKKELFPLFEIKDNIDV